MEEAELNKLQEFWDVAQVWLIQFGGKLVVAILVLSIGFWIINRFSKIINNIMIKREVDESLRPFLVKFLKITLKIIILIPVISIMGLATSSFLAILGSAGLAIGLALQGSLANFAGGVLILSIRPFSVGHFIKAGGEMGTVHKINIFNTILKTPDNQTVFIPNGQLAGNVIVNYSDEQTRRLVINPTIGYEADIPKAKEILSSIVNAHEKILDDPEPKIVVLEMADSAIVLSIRAWVLNSDYWDIYFYLQETIKLQFDKEGISIPFPQTTLSLSKEIAQVFKK